MLKDKDIRRRGLNKYIQYQFFFGYFIGMAFEKESKKNIIVTVDIR